MTSRLSTAIAIMLALVAIEMSGCFYSSFWRNDGPSQSQGVVVSLVSQRCSFEPPWTRPNQGRGFLDIWMRLRIRNDTQQSVTMDPQQMRLFVNDVAVDSTPAVAGSRHLAPSKADNVDVRFRQAANVGCDTQMSLSLKDCFLVGTQRIGLRPVTFVAAEPGSETFEGNAAPSQGFVVTTD